MFFYRKRKMVAIAEFKKCVISICIFDIIINKLSY